MPKIKRTYEVVEEMTIEQLKELAVRAIAAQAYLNLDEEDRRDYNQDLAEELLSKGMPHGHMPRGYEGGTSDEYDMIHAANYWRDLVGVLPLDKDGDEIDYCTLYIWPANDEPVHLRNASLDEALDAARTWLYNMHPGITGPEWVEVVDLLSRDGRAIIRGHRIYYYMNDEG